MGTIKQGVHRGLGLLGIRIAQTGEGALGWVMSHSKLAGRVIGYPQKCIPEAHQTNLWMQKLNLRTVIDIGGHQGEFAKYIHAILPEAAIISFEPQPDCFVKLQEVGKTLPNHRCFNLAIGETPGQTTMHQSEFSPASSLLPPSEGMEQQMPFAARTKSVNVQVDTLDSIAARLKIEDNLLVKMDVQGFETRVIKGGRSTILRAKLVIVETSFQRIYQDQPLFGDVYQLLVNELGLRYCGSIDRQPSPVDGFPLQEDSIFLRD
ncbi:MAG TPA: FkbM family methyltransferase [Tepidisphaeraceae bacterium]|nr:FkbM family methyltransferase [Tepidisphaeraceae bacterium]